MGMIIRFRDADKLTATFYGFLCFFAAATMMVSFHLTGKDSVSNTPEPNGLVQDLANQGRYVRGLSVVSDKEEASGTSLFSKVALPELLSPYFRAGGEGNTEDYDLDEDDEDDDDDDYDTDIHHNDWRKMTKGKFVSMKVCSQYVHSSTHLFS